MTHAEPGPIAAGNPATITRITILGTDTASVEVTVAGSATTTARLNAPTDSQNLPDHAVDHGIVVWEAGPRARDLG